MEIGEIRLIRPHKDFTEHSAGTHTNYYEITKEEYDRITSIENFRGKLNSEYEATMPASIKCGYGFYGANVIERGGLYYYTLCFGNSCD